MSEYVNFEYDIEDVNSSVKQTNALLRSLNAVRTIGHDLGELLRKPSLAGFFWTLIQISRAYSSLKRINRLVQAESNVALGFMKGLGMMPIVDIPDAPEIMGGMGSMDMSLRVEAFRENIPMGLEGLDISDLPEKSAARLQEIFEEEAAMTVFNARELLIERIKYPERSTGTLENSIGWEPQTNGTRIYADAYYAWWTEEGHHSFTGHHFLRDAVALSRERLPLRIKAELDELIKE